MRQGRAARSVPVIRVVKLPLHVVVLAAGQGKRMRSALPKVLHPLAGRPLLAHVLDTARTLAAARIVVVVYGHGGDAVAQALCRTRPRVRHCRIRRSGTGDALAQRAAALPAPTASRWCCSATTRWSRAETLAALVRRRGVRARSSLLTVALDDPTGYGRIVRGADGAVRAIVEHKDATPEQRAIREINTGVMAAPTALLRPLARGARQPTTHSGEYYLTDVDRAGASRRRPVDARRRRRRASSRRWASTDARARRSSSGSSARAGRRAARRRDVTLADPDAHRHPRHARLRRATSRSTSGCVFEGERPTRATASRVGAYCVLQERDGRTPAPQILPFSHLDGATIGAQLPGRAVRAAASRRGARRRRAHRQLRRGEGERDRPRARRPTTWPTSATRRSARDVNFGAGSITANYDGANKHPTVIEDDASIGSNCVLVAPVTIGRGATIGGGQHDREDAPAEHADRGAGAAGERAGLEAAGEETETGKGLNAMCGIVGAASARNVVPVLIDGIRRLEYRGYDSTGLAVIDGGAARRASSGWSAPRASPISPRRPRRRSSTGTRASRTRAGRRTARRRPRTRTRTSRAARSPSSTTASSRTSRRCASG